MKPLVIRSPRHFRRGHHPERGVTMILVAVAMVAIIGMAAMSIDVVTLYLAREEAQRAADAAALAAARVISISGITGTADPDTDGASWQNVCGPSGTATKIAQIVGAQNAVGGTAATVTVKYSTRGAPSGSPDCSSLAQSFAVNPTVLVQVQRTGLPTLFSRFWSRATNTVSATAAAEAFNPSNSGGVAPGGDAVPATPRCVKPWIIPNLEPGAGPGNGFVRTSSRRNGEIWNPGIFGIDGGVIGKSFTLTNSCGVLPNCLSMENGTPPGGSYIPVLVTPPAIAFPTCANADDYQKAIGGCDVNTVYACGSTSNPTTANLQVNPGADTSAAVQCLIHQTVGQDVLDVSSFPYQIQAGLGNPITPNNQVTASSSIVTVPIYDSSANLPGVSQPTVNIVGFLQVFIDQDLGNGNMKVHVLNVAGCGNDASTTLSAPGTSPVPIRLITAQ
jgi:Flp pilus assembly protein TadG